jgi:hypothetical protein
MGNQKNDYNTKINASNDKIQKNTDDIIDHSLKLSNQDQQIKDLRNRTISTSQIESSTDKNLITDAQLNILSKTIGENTGDQTITLTGDVTGSGKAGIVTTLANIANLNAGTYGSEIKVPQITVDSKGRVVNIVDKNIPALSPVGSILQNGNIYIGDVNNKAVSVPMTGDVTITNTGITAIGSGKVINSMLALGSVDLTNNVTGVLPIINGGTGSSSRNFVDLTSSETISGTKTFNNLISTSNISASGFVIPSKSQSDVLLANGSTITISELSNNGNFIK